MFDLVFDLLSWWSGSGPCLVQRRRPVLRYLLNGDAVLDLFRFMRSDKRDYLGCICRGLLLTLTIHLYLTNPEHITR